MGRPCGHDSQVHHRCHTEHLSGPAPLAALQIAAPFKDGYGPFTGIELYREGIA